MIMTAINALVTQAVKKMLDDGKRKYSSNVVALIDALIVGAIGMAIYYILTGTAVGVKEIIYLILMALSVWLSSMVSYDKVVQVIKQIGSIKA